MNAVARPWIGLVFRLLAVLAAIFALIFFMRMMEDRSENQKLRDHGVVSRAMVIDKKKDELVSTHSSGRRGNSSYTSTSDLWVLNIRHVPKSSVKYADFPTKVKEADLPVAPPVTGNPLKDSDHIGVMFVPAEFYDKTKVGDLLTVVNTPWDSGSPVLVADVEAFDGGASYYPRMAISLLLMLVFWLIARRISKASALRGVMSAASVPGTV